MFRSRLQSLLSCSSTLMTWFFSSSVLSLLTEPESLRLRYLLPSPASCPTLLCFSSMARFWLSRSPLAFLIWPSAAARARSVSASLRLRASICSAKLVMLMVALWMWSISARRCSLSSSRASMISCAFLSLSASSSISSLFSASCPCRSPTSAALPLLSRCSRTIDSSTDMLLRRSASNCFRSSASSRSLRLLLRLISWMASSSSLFLRACSSAWALVRSQSALPFSRRCFMSLLSRSISLSLRAMNSFSAMVVLRSRSISCRSFSICSADSSYASCAPTNSSQNLEASSTLADSCASSWRTFCQSSMLLRRQSSMARSRRRMSLSRRQKASCAYSNRFSFSTISASNLRSLPWSTVLLRRSASTSFLRKLSSSSVSWIFCAACSRSLCLASSSWTFLRRRSSSFLMVASSARLLLRSRSSSSWMARISLSREVCLRRWSSMERVLSLMSCSSFLMTPWSAELLRRSFSISSRRKRMASASSSSFLAQSCACPLSSLASLIFWSSTFWISCTLRSSTMLFRRSSSTASRSAPISSSCFRRMRLFSSSSFSRSRSMVSSLRMVASSARLLLRSLSISSRRALSSSSSSSFLRVSSLRKQSFSLRARSMSLARFQSTMLLRRSAYRASASSRSCASAFPSFSSRTFSIFLIFCWSAMLLRRSASTSSLSMSSSSSLRALLRVSSSMSADSFCSFCCIWYCICWMYSSFYCFSASLDSSSRRISSRSLFSFSMLRSACCSLICVFRRSSSRSSPTRRSMASQLLARSFSPRIFSSSLRFSSSMVFTFRPRPSWLALVWRLSASSSLRKPSISWRFISLLRARSLMTRSARSCSVFMRLRSLLFCWSWDSPSLSCPTSWALSACSSRAFLSATSATSFRFRFSASICRPSYCSFFSFSWSRLPSSFCASSAACLRFFSSSSCFSYSWYFLRAYSSTPTDFRFSFSSSKRRASSCSSSISIPPSSSLFLRWRASVSRRMVSSTNCPFLFSSVRSCRSSRSSSSVARIWSLMRRCSATCSSNRLRASAFSRFTSTVRVACWAALSRSRSSSFSPPDWASSRSASSKMPSRFSRRWESLPTMPEVRSSFWLRMAPRQGRRACTLLSRQDLVALEDCWGTPCRLCCEGAYPADRSGQGLTVGDRSLSIYNIIVIVFDSWKKVFVDVAAPW